MVLCHKLFTFESPYRRKIRRFKTVLVVYLVQWNYARDPTAEAPRGLFHTLLLTICKRPEEKPLDRRRCGMLRLDDLPGGAFFIGGKRNGKAKR